MLPRGKLAEFRGFLGLHVVGIGASYVKNVLAAQDLDCGMSGSATGVVIDGAQLPPSVAPCVGNVIRRAGMSRARRERGEKGRGRQKARAVLDRPPPLQGWRTTDDDEIALRRWRGRTEIVAIEALEPKQPFFGTFRVQSGSGGFYEVEIRDLDGLQQFLRLYRSSRQWPRDLQAYRGRARGAAPAQRQGVP